MRKITSLQITVFFLLAGCVLGLAVYTDWLILYPLPWGEFRGVAVVLGGVLLLYTYAIFSYRLFMKFFPLLPGDVPIGSRQEFIYHIHLLLIHPSDAERFRYRKAAPIVHPGR